MNAVSARSEPETAADVTALARHALAHWGVHGGEPELLKYRENAVFRVRLADGRPAALRIHRLGYHSDAALRSELQWMAFLQSAGVATPSPVPTLAGDLFVPVGLGTSTPRQVDCLSWLEGCAVGARGVPLGYTPLRARDVFTAIGRTIARMHNAAAGWAPPPGFARHAWDFDGFFGANPTWGRFETCPFLDDANRELVHRAHHKAVEALSRHERSARNFGLIHADLVRENVLLDGDSIQIIDFDDCGHGWHAYIGIRAGHIFRLRDRRGAGRKRRHQCLDRRADLLPDRNGRNGGRVGRRIGRIGFRSDDVGARAVAYRDARDFLCRRVLGKRVRR